MSGEADSEKPEFFKDVAWRAWGDKYGVDPPWSASDYAMLQKASKQCGSVEEASAAWSAFLKNSDPFFEGHPPRLFLASLSRWVVKSLRRPSIVKSAESFPGAKRAAEMTRILIEVEKDDTIPGPMKRSEAARRWKEIPKDL